MITDVIIEKERKKPDTWKHRLIRPYAGFYFEEFGLTEE